MELVPQYWWIGLIAIVVIVLLSKKTSKAFGGETEEIDAKRAAELIEQEQALLIDLAEKTTFDKGHISCAVNMPGISFINGTAELSVTSKPVILVPDERFNSHACGAVYGQCWRAENVHL